MQAAMSHQSEPENTAHPPETIHRRAIRDSITQALFLKSEADCDDPRHRFIPRAALLDVIDLTCVEQLLQTFPAAEGEQNGNLRQRVAQQICTSSGECSCAYAHCTGGRMIFSILLLCAREDLVLSSFFLRTPQICDQDLPLRIDSLNDINCNLSPKEKELFIYNQWKVYTPLLTEFDKQTSQAVDAFPEEVSLPWAKKERIGERIPAEVSFVEKVEIHLYSHDLTPETTQVFALKTFEQRLAPGLSKKRFQKEVEANLQTPKHDRIVRLLTAFTYRERFYLLFPHANEGSLERLWRSYVPAGVVQESTQAGVADWYTDDWLVGECLGIAGALAAIHSLVDDGSGEITGLLHADIKPENILCFREPGPAAPAVLKLADFGEAKVIEPGVTLKASKVAHVLTYRPPEHSPNGVITLNYDVWCLGCLFLDFITWAILGQDGVDSFSTIREDEQDDQAVTEAPGQLIEDVFFRQDPTSLLSTKLRPGYRKKLKVEDEVATTRYSLWIASHVKVASRLKHGVVSHLKSLQEHDRCSDQLRKILLFVGEKMLVVDPKGRADSRQVRAFLSDL